MRIITGKAKGKKLLPAPENTTRPILDRVKTSLFSILRPQIEGSSWLDLFAGCGSVGLEALSEGAANCTFIELNKEVCGILRKNAELTGLFSQCEIQLNDAFLFLKKTSKEFDFIYIDPPQFKSMWHKALLMIAERPNLLAKDGIIICKIHPKEDEDLELGSLKIYRKERYGNSLLLFISN